MKKIILSLLVIILYLSCQKNTVAATGTLDGTFTLSPLCGVEPASATPANPCGLSDAQLDAIYSQYKIVITDGNAKSVGEKKFDHTGLFSFDLPAGNYNVDIQPKPQFTTTINNKSVQSFPSGISVLSSQKVSLIINVDTGIR